MEYAVIEEANVPVEITEIKDTESTETFQKFIQELFEKNGILNDLRAYLRVHILDVLKSAETGDLTPCQKNFTQRLELSFQAMNILITEYLLRLDLNYSLSVFTSEIPLSNMVFKFAKTLLKTNDTAISELRFGECDIWKILNYLGIKCDSEHASKIVETYKSQTDSPLLWCILKCIPMYNEPALFEQMHTSEESLSRVKSEGSHEDRMTFAHEISNKCKHYTVCKDCQERYTRLKEKYKRKKIELEEMYEQLKTAYETEVDMIRDENEKKIRRSIANHALQLQNYRDELEKSFAARHRQLGESVRQRQRALCALAQRLAAVQAQEKSHKIQMQDAEETLKNKCELMRRQIAEELKILQNNLETVKQERDDIDRQKAELESLKQIYNTNHILKEKTLKENEDLKRHYDLLKDEIAILKKCLENSKTPKYLVEKGTETDSHVNNLNNGSVGSLKIDDERLKVSQVVNDFKKQKNVNFSQKYSEDLEDHQRGSFNVEMRSETENITIQHLRDENERLKAFAKQQSEHIDRLTADRQRFHNEGTRPRTAPSTALNSYYTQSVVNYPCELGVQPRVLFPTDAIPFIGVVGNRQSDDNRRRLLSQWRRQRSSEESCKTTSYIGNQANTSTNVPNNKQTDDVSQPIVRETPAAFKPESPAKSALRDKSTNKVRKAKQNLRNNNLKEPTPSREKSPNATLREAKLRLRKLEIEAEAVQRSYLDYRKRQMEMKGPRESFTLVEDSIINIEDIRNIDKKQRQSSEKLEKNYSKSEKFVYKDSPETIKNDFDKYFREYQNIDIGKTHFCNLKTVIEKIKPIPESYSKLQDDSKYNNINYLETPLLEFRKFYQTGNKIKNNERINLKPNDNNLDNDDERSEETSPKLVDKVIIETSSHLKVQENIYKNNTNQDIVKNEPPTKLLENTVIETSSQLKFQENNKNNNKNDYSDVKNELQMDIKIQENNEDSNNQIISLSETQKDTKINPEFVHMKESKEESLNQPNIVELNYTENKIENNKVDTSKDGESSPPIEINNEKSATVLEEQAVEETIDLIEVEKQNTDIEVVNDENINNDNILIVAVENVRTTTNIGATESSQDMLVVVESSIDNNGLVLSETESTKEIIPTQMTIIVSPKEDSILKAIDNANLLPEMTILSENDVLSALYHSDNNKVSSLDLAFDENKLEIELNSEKESQEYQDDFSADVDNYNSQSEYGNNSPISLPQTSENDNFWDS